MTECTAHDEACWPGESALRDRALLTEGAAAALARRVAEGSDDVEDYRSLAGHLYETGHPEEALRIYRQCLAMPMSGVASAWAARDLGSLLYRQGDYAEATTLAHDSLRRHSGTRSGAHVARRLLRVPWRARPCPALLSDSARCPRCRDRRAIRGACRNEPPATIEQPAPTLIRLTV